MNNINLAWKHDTTVIFHLTFGNLRYTSSCFFFLFLCKYNSFIGKITTSEMSDKPTLAYWKIRGVSFSIAIINIFEFQKKLDWNVIIKNPFK